METLYGRNGQFARTFGWDMHWDANSPGDDDPDSAKRHKQKFVATPNLFASMYMPYGPGIRVMAGIFGPAIGYEIPPNIREARNPFASKTYAWSRSPAPYPASLPALVCSMAKAVCSGPSWVWCKAGTICATTTVANQLWGLRWRTADMGTWVDYEFMEGDEENHNIDDVQAPTARLISPHGHQHRAG